MVSTALRRVLAASVVAGACLATPPCVAAVDLRDVLTDYTYTTWTRKDGIAGPVWAIAQDVNGFLWLGTDGALVRFDGVRFVTWEALGGQPLPRLPIRALRVAADGAMWIGYAGTGGLACIRGRTVTAYLDAVGGDTMGTVTAIVDDQHGNVWASAGAGLFRLRESGWERVGPDEGLPAGGPTYAYLDHSGRLWVSTLEGIFRRDGHGKKFELVEAAWDRVRTVAFSEDSTGRVWATDSLQGFRALGPGSESLHGKDAGRGLRLLHDRNGNLWVATIGQGLWRAKNQADGLVVERTTLLTGLSSDAVRTVFEDRDGNIWAGTTDGVDRLVEHRIIPLAGLGLVSTIASLKDGRVWAGTADELIAFEQTPDGWQPSMMRLPIRGAAALRAADGGSAWLSTLTSLYRLDGNTARQVPTPRGARPFAIEALTVDKDGEAWVVASGGEIYHSEAGVLHLIDRIPDLAKVRTTAALIDRQRRLWIAYAGSQVGVLTGRGQFRSFGQVGFGDTPHYDLYEDTLGSIWICGGGALSRFDTEAFATVGRSNGLPTGGPFTMIEDTRGDLWVATSNGIIRLDRAEFDRASSDPHYLMRFNIYDASDGLAGYPSTFNDQNAVRAADGSLWFLTSRGISIADPERLPTGRSTPLVAIDEVRADDVRIDGAVLAPGTSKVEIDYTAPELTSPLRTRFRYRLEGFDNDWIDAGTRRQALYTGLPPRDYRFRVAVSQDDGRWSEVEATWAFALRPRFHQTWWFYGVTALTIAAITWGTWQFRVRQLRRQFALVLGERVRLSRELHDTLLQSLVGVALEFDAVSKAVEVSPGLARERVIKIREQVEEYIREARRSIWSLRSPALETGDLIEALREAGARATSGHNVAFTFEQSGTVRRLGSNVEHQLLRIGQEAVLNAVRHAEGSAVAMRLQYTDEAVVLSVVDNGRGFDVSAATVGTTDHYGLTTMRERAEQAGGQLHITSAQGAGTRVEAVVPIKPASEEAHH